MSITRNVGGMSSYLDHIRMAAPYTELKMGVTNALKKIPKVGDGMVDALHKTKSSIKQLVIPGMLFENMGLTYLIRCCPVKSGRMAHRRFISTAFFCQHMDQYRTLLPFCFLQHFSQLPHIVSIHRAKIGHGTEKQMGTV